MRINKHYTIGLIFILIFSIIGIWFFSNYQHSAHYRLRMDQLPPILPMSKKELQNLKNIEVESADALLQRHFQKKIQLKASPPAWIIKLGPSFTEKEAKKLLARIRELKLDSFEDTIEDQSLEYLYVGPFLDREEADRVINKLQESLKVHGVLEQYRVGLPKDDL